MPPRRPARSSPAPARVPARTSVRTVAGRWQLLEQIGAGGTATVWRAHDLQTGQEVAAKVLGRHTGALLARFWREQEIRLRHPHLVTATGWAAEEDVVLLITDLVRGGSTLDLLATHGPLPEGVVATVMTQTLSALVSVHSSGLVHRDVTPGNLLLDATPDGSIHVRLGDFGVAVDTAAPRLTVDGTIGTVGYVAPDCDHTPDPRHDLYSVGAVAVHLLTGAAPRPDLPLPASRLSGVIGLLLSPDRLHRPASAAHALALLERLQMVEEPGPWVRDELGPSASAATLHLPSWQSVAASAVLTLCLLVSLWCLAAMVLIATGIDLGLPFLHWMT